jgi:hypothetical protein
MPTTSGQYQLQDYLAELKVRGFDGFSDADLMTYINRGYFAVARKSQWYWEETTDAITLPPGVSSVSLWPATSGELPGLRSLDKAVVTTSGFTKVLKPLSDADFFPNLGLDLSKASLWGEPTGYYIWNQQLYVLPPTQSQRDLLVYYHRRVVAMVNPTDVPITPPHLDEAILLAALVRCHKRANESGLATEAEADLEEIYDDMRDDEENMSAEKLDRTTPDNTWL